MPSSCQTVMLMVSSGRVAHWVVRVTGNRLTGSVSTLQSTEATGDAEGLMGPGVREAGIMVRVGVEVAVGVLVREESGVYERVVVGVAVGVAVSEIIMLAVNEAVAVTVTVAIAMVGVRVMLKKGVVAELTKELVVGLLGAVAVAMSEVVVRKERNKVPETDPLAVTLGEGKPLAEGVQDKVGIMFSE